MRAEPLLGAGCGADGNTATDRASRRAVNGDGLRPSQRGQGRRPPAWEPR